MPDVHEFFIDIGARDATEAKTMDVAAGQPIKLEYRFNRLGTKIAGTALDNRVVVFVLAAMMRALDHDDDPPEPTITAIFATQEEVGSRRAATTTRAIKSDYALALDITSANDLPKQHETEHIARVGPGPAIRSHQP